MSKKQEVFWIKLKENNPKFKNVTFGFAWNFGDSIEMGNELAKFILQSVL